MQGAHGESHTLSHDLLYWSDLVRKAQTSPFIPDIKGLNAGDLWLIQPLENLK